ncbi:arginine/serine-rich coiled-coil protein 2 isoform X2 [Helicoverpa zea]|uniref:arginine/serine-rich coiled-coil protein 2 isoform X2 n=1 Tax=Helicoverpa zea TaxID=7113 RepID=UPI001F56E9ED|nr:arginine/serine-rich coiled-coil protein 2 isoform X2 [Helicoverpa zea]
MDCLVGYGSEDENESERYGSQQSSDSQDAESEPELPQAEPTPPLQSSRDERRSNDSRERDRDRDRGDRSDRGDRELDRRDRRRESPARARSDRDRSDRRSPRRDDRYRSDRDRGRAHEGVRRGLLGDRPDDREKMPALMDLKPFSGDGPPPGDRRSHDARDAVSPRFVDRERRDKERDRERERDRDRHGRRSEERSGRSSSHRHDGRSRSRSRSRGAPHSERRAEPPAGDYRPSSYKVNKKLEVMEKMGLQIKTPDGSMATAQQLRAAACEVPAQGSHLPSYYNPTAVNANKIMDQVQKRKLLWSNKNKSEAEEAAKWSGTRFAQDSDGKQVSKFMRLMGIKEPAAVKNETPEKAVDPIKKQEELFQAMQAQYEVARATTHTMRGVGLGFQRGQY